MKKFLSLAVLSALVVAVYKAITGQKHEETLWREATKDLDLR